MQVNLSEPGAGLPFLEKVKLKVFFRVLTRVKGRDEFVRLFRSEEAKIRGLVEGLSADQGSKAVLVKRVMGMEDSSRNWSMYMTLEHLNVVNDGLRGIIVDLVSKDSESSELGEVRTQDVKPSRGADERSVDEFVRMNDEVMGEIEKLGELGGERKHEHPWFGMMDGAQWFALMGVHMRVHRKQLERIIEQLEVGCDDQ
ncbi:MAG: hypothetical protein ACSHX6_09345 [Akkermansiaceae bacterium]